MVAAIPWGNGFQALARDGGSMVFYRSKVQRVGCRDAVHAGGHSSRVEAVMTFDDVSGILKRILQITATHVRGGRRLEIRNERYFHHMFSTLAGRQLWPDPEQAWTDLFLHPEAPTRTLFQFRGKLNVYDAAATARDAVGTGVPGLIDFMVRRTPRVLVEWKGPKVFTERGIAEVFLKLLTEPAEDLKVVAAIITSSRTDRADHRRTIVERFDRFGLAFAQQVLAARGVPVDLARANLYACIATIPDSGVREIHWGPVTGPLPVS